MNNALQANALLQGGKYRIIKTLGQGGFGITYLAEQTNLERLVCIKELFIKGYGARDDDGEATVLASVTASMEAVLGDYREKFVKEAKTIARLEHPEIVRIHDVFEENGTAYYVMDYIEGDNFKDLVKKEGALSEGRALRYIRQVGEALSYVHGKRIMHLDIKPSNIIVRKSDDRPILIDFGTAKQFDAAGSQTSTSPIGVSAGYSAIELMKVGGVQAFCPEADVYSLAATLYYLVSGMNPPDASDRMEMIIEGKSLQYPDTVSRELVHGIEQALQPRKLRPRTVSLFLDSLPLSAKKDEEEKPERVARKVPEAKEEPAASSEPGHPHLEAAEAAGDADAQKDLGLRYLEGRGVRQDYKEALKWLGMAAEQGNAEAMNYIGICFLNGYGVLKDLKSAFVWFGEAADEGLAMAQCNLGWCYLNGCGVYRNHKEAVIWFRKAADQGNADAIFYLAGCYHHGMGVPKDKEAAMEWLQKAADLGHEEARRLLDSPLKRMMW